MMHKTIFPAAAQLLKGRRVWVLAPAAALSVALAAAPLSAQDAPGGVSSVKAAAEGQQIFEEICAACHMADARGGAGAGTGVPALAGNAHLADRAFAARTVYHGRGGMPRFAGMLSNDQIAAVLTYVRGHFNAYTDQVTPADVDAVASATTPKPDCTTCGK